MTDVLGKISFLEAPDVNGAALMINGGGVPVILSGITSARPTAGTGDIGRLYLDITTNTFYRDNGASWDNLSPTSTISGTTNQITVVPGTNVTPTVISLANNVVMPGLAGYVPPTGATADRPLAPVDGQSRYNTTLGYSEVYSNAAWIPEGRVIQVVTGSIAASSGTVTIPLDNTTPLITEGNQIWTQAFTPLTTVSRITIRFSITAASSATSRIMILAVFAGSTCISASAQTTAATIGAAANLSMGVAHNPGSTAPITFSARLGSSAAGTAYCNQTNAATLGGAFVTEYTIMEVV
jgi:hypothetical protein